MGEMLTSLGMASNAKTVSRHVDTKSCFRTGFGLSFERSNLEPGNFMLRYLSKSIAQGRLQKVLITFVLVVFCTLAAFTNGSAQKVGKATDKPVGKATDPPVSTPRRRERPRVRPAVTATIPSTIESDQFLDLGDRFRKEGKWNAAEAAYKESIKVWSSNGDALLELGFLYLDRNRLPEAQGVHSKLRAVNSSLAAELLADINRYKAASR